MANGPVSPEGGTPDPVLGQPPAPTETPTPVSQSTEGSPAPPSEGQWPSVDAWTQRAQAAEPTRETLGGGPTSFEAFAEKPTNDYEALERYFERIRANVPSEQMEAMGRAMRERLKGAVGVKDTADLNPQARRFLETFQDWLFGKIK